MKKVFLFAMSATMLTFFFGGCRKSKDNTTPIPKNLAILAKWSVESIIDHDYEPPTDTTSTYPGVAADYIDFRDDGKVYRLLNGFHDTSNYALSGDTNVIINAALILKIQSLTDHELKLYYIENYSTPGYFEESFNLKK